MSDNTCAKCGRILEPNYKTIGDIAKLSAGYSMGTQARKILSGRKYKAEDKLCGVKCFWEA